MKSKVTLCLPFLQELGLADFNHQCIILHQIEHGSNVTSGLSLCSLELTTGSAVFQQCAGCSCTWSEIQVMTHTVYTASIRGGRRNFQCDLGVYIVVS